jgi:hypothetical protein
VIKFIKQSALVTEDIIDILREVNITQPAAPKAIRTAPVQPTNTTAPAAPQIAQKPDAQPAAQEHVPGSLETGAIAHAQNFNNPANKFKIKKSRLSSANETLHASSQNGGRYFIKPHTDVSNRVEPEDWDKDGYKPTVKDWEEPEHWNARNTTANRVLDAMNMSHMGVHTFHGEHEGRPAQVSASAAGPGVVHADEADPEQLARINAHHRVAGMVHGILTSNPDAHHGNVLVNTVNNHPVHIADNDLAFSSRMQRNNALVDPTGKGRHAVMSVYGPGESLDYRRGKVVDPETGQEREGGEVGHNFHPDIRHAIEMAANGKLGHGLSDEDHATMINNANDLLTHGLEGTMKRRQMVPTYKRKSELNKLPAVLPNEQLTKPRPVQPPPEAFKTAAGKRQQ